jgi:hypothetical protein
MAAARTTTDVSVMRRSVAREVAMIWFVIFLGGLLAYVPPPGEGEAAMSSRETTS